MSCGGVLSDQIKLITSNVSKEGSSLSRNGGKWRDLSIVVAVWQTLQSKHYCCDVCCTQLVLGDACALVFGCVRKGDGHPPLFLDAHRCESIRKSAFPHIFAIICAYANNPHHSAFAATAWPSLLGTPSCEMITVH